MQHFSSKAKAAHYKIKKWGRQLLGTAFRSPQTSDTAENVPETATAPSLVEQDAEHMPAAATSNALTSMAKSSTTGTNPSIEASANLASTEALAVLERPLPKQTKQAKKQLSKRRTLPKNFLLKRLDALYWKRLLRYLYIRFLRMQGSPEAIARGVAAGFFAGSFPLLGFQTLIGVALASVVRGNKLMAAVSTWISNPLTYIPIFALNFRVGSLLLQLPKTTVLPSSLNGMTEWMNLGMTVTSALLVGSFAVGLLVAVVGYYLGLFVARRARSARRR